MVQRGSEPRLYPSFNVFWFSWGQRIEVKSMDVRQNWDRDLDLTTRAFGVGVGGECGKERARGPDNQRSEYDRLCRSSNG